MISTKGWDRNQINALFDEARAMQHAARQGNYKPVLRNKLMASMFFEPSTRTRISFEAAMKRLGGEVIVFPDRELSSMKKGESFRDSIRTVSEYCDVIVLRHSDPNAMQEAVEASTVPVINAGDGAGEHPTQAMLDLFTIQQEQNTIDGLKIMFDGDLKYSRTVHSLLFVLAQYDVEVFCNSPLFLQVPHEYRWHGRPFHIAKDHDEREEMLMKADVLYLVRPQIERWAINADYFEKRHHYGIDANSYRLLKEDSIIMHPLPRTWELPVWVDDKPQAAYWKQLKYGLYIRMALLARLCYLQGTTAETIPEVVMPPWN